MWIWCHKINNSFDIISEVINVICAKIIVKAISKTSLFLIFQIILEKNTQSNAQYNIHQIAIDKKIQVQEKTDQIQTQVHSKIIHKITKNKASAVQSLNKLSPSKIKVSLLGAQIVLKIDKTATGSVAEINHQNNRQTKNGILKPTIGSK